MKLFGVVLGLVFVFSLGGRAMGEARNKCGCYKDGAGTCFCDKKAKCGCPGDCEPKGCEEARDRELQKEIDAETKKASAGGSHRKAGGEDQGGERETPAKSSAAHPKMTGAQSKQLAKLLDLYLSDHPDARGKSIEEVRSEVAGH